MKRSLYLALVILMLVPGGAQSMAQVGTIEPSTPEAINRMVTIYPAEAGPGEFVTLTVNAGEAEEFQFIVGNAGNITQRIRAYPIPALTADNGGFSAASYGTEPDEPTSWLDFSEMTMEFEPGEGQEVAVSVAVPADTPPGEYITAIAAEQAEAYDIEGTEVMTQRVRIPMPVLIIVPGPLEPSFDLASVDLERREGMIIAVVRIENTGTAILRLEGTARLLDGQGAVLGVSDIDLEPIFVNTSANMYVGWPDAGSLEEYGIQIELMDPDNSATASMTVKELTPVAVGDAEPSAASTPVPELTFARAVLEPLTDDNPPSMLTFAGEISNPGDPIDNARVSIVTYQNGLEIDRYPVLQGVTLETGITPLEGRYALPGGFTNGTYTFEVTIEVGDTETQSVLVSHPVEFEIVIP